MNQDKNLDKRCSERCQKIFRAIRRKVRGEEDPGSAQSEADPSLKALDNQSKPEGGRRITLVLANGEGKSSTSDFPDNRVAIVAPRTEPVNTPGHQGPGQSTKIVAVTEPANPVRGSGSEITGPGSNAGGSDGEVPITHRERTDKTRSGSTLSADQESKGSGHDMDHRFTDFINRTWLKIRAMSNVGEGKNHSPTKDTGHGHHDHFADYINRPEKKLRTTSNIGSGGGGGGGGGRGLSFSSK
ncbi:uncharacterized protein J3R85_011158 [Psidium guajava]|nr:uncharacterized protein J3R85_011158 [Psidium guajava]